jgi:hypothetical protein
MSMKIELCVIDGVGYQQTYAKLPSGEVLLIGGVDPATGDIYRGHHMHRSDDLRKLDEASGWTGGYNYDHHLATARGLLATAPLSARRVSGISAV